MITPSWLDSRPGLTEVAVNCHRELMVVSQEMQKGQGPKPYGTLCYAPRGDDNPYTLYPPNFME